MARTLKTDVIIGGSTTAGFDSLSQKILALGQVFNQVGGKVSKWEQESIETYKDYETYMLEAKGAMSANYQSASQLENEYNALQAKAQEWAGSTIFHTNDVAKAISEAAHAGWDYDKMLQGIPEAMLLAQAGNTDLSTGLDMLIKNINGTGIAFDDAGSFVDEWAMAANTSATTISELGEAMMKMGATARFGDSTGELLTMLAVLANTGTVGSAAGTLLRNSMIRLIAPTKNAREAMEGLGVEADEINEAVGSDSETLAEVNTLLKNAGFSAYDSNGKLKPFLTTFKDLYTALKRMGSEEERNKVLSAIFPTRTITGAKSLLEAAANDYDGLLDKILASEGYAEKVANIQMSGLMGTEELFRSKWEEFSRKIGETLSDPLEKLYNFGGDAVDWLNSLDKGALAAISGAATAISTAGPGLVTVGLAMKMFSMVGGWGTSVLLGAVAIGAIVGYLGEMNQLALDNNFGQMSIDLESVNDALTSIGDDLDKKFEKLTQFREESEKAAKEYKQAGQKVIESMWSDMVTGKELTEKDQKAIDSQAEKVMVAMKTSIAKAAQEKLEFASQLFANEDGSVSEGDVSSLPLFASITGLVEYGMQDAIAKAQSLSADLRRAITNAFTDKKLTEEEMRNIQSIISQMNELIDSYGSSDITEEMLLNKSQRVSRESLEDFTEQVKAAKDKAFAETDDQMDYMEAWLRKAYNAAVKNGVKVFDPVSEGWVDPNEVNIDDLIASTHEMYTGKRTEWGSAFDEILRRGHQNALATTDTGALFTEAQYYISKAQEGLISFSEANELIANSASGNQQLLHDSMQYTIDYFGGIGEMADLVRQYRGKSDAQSQKLADWLEQIILIEEALGGSQIGADLSDLQPDTQKSNQQMMDYLSEIYKTGEGEEAMMAYFNSMNDAQKKAWNNAVDALEKQYDLKDLGTSYAPYSVFAEGGKTLGDDTLRWLGAYVAGNLSLRNPEVRENLVDYQQPAAGQPTFGGIPVAQITPYAEGFDQLDAIDDMLESQGALKIPIDANTDKLETAIKAEDLKTLMAYVDGDASGLQVAIMSEDGKTLKQYVTGDASQLDSIIKEHQGETLRLSISGIPHVGPPQPEGEQPMFGGVPVAKIAPYAGEQNPLESLSNQLESQGAVEVQVDGDTKELQTAIKAEDLKTLMEYVDGDPSQLGIAVMSEDGKTLLERVTGEASQLDTLINSYQGRTIRLNITGLGFFAEGGRAVEPSIFGEAGPEWAIPEEHSLRTANLLNAAREASGFTWGELLERNGGLNAGGDINVSISSYAPVINANDVTGVADELTKDKARLGEVVRKAVKSALDDMNMKNGIEVYA